MMRVGLALVSLVAFAGEAAAATAARPKAAPARKAAPPRPKAATPAAPAPARPAPPPPAPPAPVPAAHQAFPCKASDPAPDGKGKLGAGLLSIRSNVGDRFSIRGKDGVFVCRAGVRELTRAQVAKDGTVSGLSVAQFSEAKGSTYSRLFHMPDTEKRLQRVADRLADAWPHPDAPRVKIRLAADTQFNAHAHPDNVIVVNVGVFAPAPGMERADMADNDLYWILGHEYAHVALRHANRSEALQNRSATARRLAGAAMEGAKINATFNYVSGHGGGDLDKQMRTTKAAHRQFQFALLNFVDPAWGRTNEDQADVAGFDVATALGYFPRFDLATARLEQSEKTMEQRLGVINLRVSQNVQGVMKEETFKRSLERGALSDLFSKLVKNIQDGLIRGVKDFLTGWFSRDHRGAKSRAEGLTDYRAEAYIRPKLMGAPQIFEGEAGQVETSAEMGEALTATRAIEAAENDLTNADPAKAQTSIAPAFSTRFRGESLTLFVAAQAAEGAGDRAEAIRLLERSRVAPTFIPGAQAMLASLYTKGNRLDPARGIIAEGRRKSEDDDYFLPEDVRIAARGRQIDTVATLLDRCRATGRELIAINCVEAALDVEWDKLNEAQQIKLRDVAEFGSAGDAKDNAPMKAVKTLKGLAPGFR